MNARYFTQYLKIAILSIHIITLSGCALFSHGLLDLNNMPEQAPKNINFRLAWGLWKLDLPVIKDTLAAGAQPYAVEKVVNVASYIPQGKHLSTYALILEGYLARIHMVENRGEIQAALNQLYECVEYLIKQKISVDYGVNMLENNPSMREFVRDSIAHLNAEKKSEGFLDGEGMYALDTLQRIQAAINEYQPSITPS